MKKEFKVGDICYIPVTIISINNGNRIYKINAKINGGSTMCFTEDGKFLKDYTESSLFHIEDLQPKSEYPKLMIVSDDLIDGKNKDIRKRVVFMKKNDRYIAWSDADTIEKAEKTLSTCSWKYAKDIPKEVPKEIIHLTFKDISEGKGVGIDPSLIRIKE